MAWSVKSKDSKRTVVQNEAGQQRTLLTPHGKGAKFATELRNKTRITNEGVVKKDKSGKRSVLTREQAAYRSGYLDAQKDAANAYNSKKKKTSGRKKTTSSRKS